MPYLGEAFCNEGDVRVGAFGGGGANFLVGTTGAGIAFSGLF